ncbi:FmdB family zinc ribbon protein [Phytoactinopolyspora mesophila]|uniref:Zinc ribbon domain-containing protein n=1 Tax=Phytoactinopolyspora mesophila TaxID=2650750 RepID=A0A7K3M7N1_9ACTN|nr:zinc ribbon domain-containing protein [Phytoactinopolyspora mesophila]NDL59333.1 zinc ribbon domain-containing protein [Phytoactinopolyspora mesophila]
MPIYDYTCECGNRFEMLVRSADGPSPDCPGCGGPTRRRPSAVRLGGTASAGRSRDDAPKSWLGTRQGDRETLRHWHRQLSQREKLEEKYPELAGDRRPVLAHEGRFAGAPLRAGDILPTKGDGGAANA